MILPVNAIVTEPTSITMLPAAPLHALEIWSNPQAVATRIEKALGFALPVMNRSAGNAAVNLLRYEPTVWLVEGDVAVIADTLGDDGALTAIGGGIVRMRLAGPHWRELLLEGGFFFYQPRRLPGWRNGCDRDRPCRRAPLGRKRRSLHRLCPCKLCAQPAPLLG